MSLKDYIIILKNILPSQQPWFRLSSTCG